MDEHMRKFVAVAEHGGFTKAAKAIRVSQPALSVAIKALERDLNTKLFTRDGRQVALTLAGRTLYQSAKQIDGILQNTRHNLAQQAGQLPSLRLGLIDSMAEQFFVQRDFTGQLAKETDLSLLVDRSAKLLDDVQTGAIDAAFITAQPERLAPNLKQQVVGVEPLVTIVSSQATVPLNRPYPYISYNYGSTTERLVREVLDIHGFVRRSVFYSTSPEIMLRQCLAGAGAATLPFFMVKKHLEEVSLILADGGQPIIRRSISFIHRKDRHLPACVESFVAEAAQVLEAQSQQAASFLEQLSPPSK